MFLNQIDHIAIATNNSSKCIDFFINYLNFKQIHEEKMNDMEIFITVLKNKFIHLEIITPINENSFLNKFIKKHNTAIHHIAFKTDDIFANVNYLKNKGIKFTKNIIEKGIFNKNIIFIHPKSTGGILIELCQK